MRERYERHLILLLVVFAVLFLLVNTDFKELRVDLDNWIEYVLVVLFDGLLFYFWRQTAKAYREEIKEASATDPLSELYNAHHFFKTLDAEADRSKRREHSLSILFMDIDYFHRYNQQHGLEAGNKVLRFVGELIRNSTRKYDSGFRFGNDEFSLLLPETDRIQARMIGERIRESFFNHFGGELGLSVGAAMFEEGDTVDKIVRKAQMAMQEARRSGGNRVRSFIDRGEM